MANFQSQIEYLTGITSVSSYRDSISQYLKDGVNDVTQRVTKLRPDEVTQFQRESSSQSAQKFDSGSAKIINVMRESGTSNDWRVCKQVPSELQGRVVDVNSIHYASKFNPVYIIQGDGDISIFPAPSGDPDNFIVTYVNNDPVANDGTTALAYSHDEIGYFPKDKTYLVALYASVKLLDKYIALAQTFDTLDIADIVLSDLYVFSNVPSIDLVQGSLPEFSIPGAFVPPVPPVNSGIDFSEVGTIETFNVPIFSEPTLPAIPDMSLPSVPTPPSIVGNTVSITGTAPAYNKPNLTLSAAITVDNLVIGATSPTAPSLTDNSLSFSTAAPTYNKPVVSLEAKPTISDLSISIDTPTVPAILGEQLSFSSSVPTFNSAVASPNFNDADTWINTEEDSEMSNARVSVIQSQIQKYQADIQNETQKFNELNNEYQTEFQKAVQKAQLTNSEDASQINLYQQKLQNYVNQVNEQVQQYQTNFQKDLQLWETNRTTVLNQYQIDVQNELNNFNKDNAEYQIEFQRSLNNANISTKDDEIKVAKYQSELQNYVNEVNTQVQEYQMSQSQKISSLQVHRTTELNQYQLDIQNELNEYNKELAIYQVALQKDLQDSKQADEKEMRDLQKYSAEITSYGAEVNKEVSRWQSEEFNKVFNEWQALLSSRVQSFNSEIQLETSRVNASLQDYTIKVQKSIQKYQSETGFDLSVYQNELQVNTARFQNDLAKNNANFQNLLAKYNAEVQKVSTHNQNNLTRYTAEVQKFSADNQHKITKYGAEVQNMSVEIARVKSDIETYLQRSMKLEKQYNEAFLMMAPRQQQGEK
jgi:hypothetical protein